MYPCPNPVCDHEFEPSEVAGVAALICPKCGMIIQLQATPATVPIASPVAAAPPAGVPMARAVPMASPVTAQVPLAQGADVQAASTTRGAARAVAARRAGRRHRAAPLCSQIQRPDHLLAGDRRVSPDYGAGDRCHPGLEQRHLVEKSVRRQQRIQKLRLQFLLGKAARLAGGRALKEKFGVRMLAQQRSNPAAYMALDALDPKDRTPTVREMDAQARKLLANYFKKTLEADPIAEGDLAGHNANWFPFFGQNDEIAARGEVYFFAEQGIGYWIYTSAPEADFKGLQKEFAGLRGGFAILGKRDKWEQVQSRQTVLTGAKAKGYQLVDTTGRWEKEPDSELDAYDPKADMALKADDPTSKIKSMGANLVVMVLDKAEDPVAAAKAHILAKHKREGYPATRIAEVEGEIPKDRVGESQGHLLKWRISNGDGRERYAAVGVVARAGDLLVIYAEAPWERRFTWEEAFQRIIESLQVKE